MSAAAAWSCVSSAFAQVAWQNAPVSSGSFTGTHGLDVPCGEGQLNQNVDVETILDEHTVQCAFQEVTSENGFARAFLLEADATVCAVQFPIAMNYGGPWTVTVNLYKGDPTGPFEELELRASSPIVNVPDGVFNDFFVAYFEGVQFFEGETMVVELYTPERIPEYGGDGGGLWFGSNNAGESSPTYIRAPECDATDFVTMDVIGAPGVHILMTVYREECGAHPVSFDNPPTSLSGSALALVEHDDGSGAGPALYAGGTFEFASQQTVNAIAGWRGNLWFGLDDGVNGSVLALASHAENRATDASLFAGGTFTEAGDATVSRIARWDGSTWSDVGGGVNGTVFALAVYDDGLGEGPALYAGGAFSTAGGTPAVNVAKWNGKEWSALNGGVGGSVRALIVFDDGTGPQLYVGGVFTSVDGSAASRIARWDGKSWEALGLGLNGTVNALAVHDNHDGEGPFLFVGGNFSMAGGAAASNLARWRGGWSTVGGGVTGSIFALSSFDEGPSAGGTALFAGGSITMANGMPVDDVAKWTGSNWVPMGLVLENTVRCMTAYTPLPPAASELFIGGSFVSVFAGNFITRWQGCNVIGLQGDLDNDGVVDFDDQTMLCALLGLTSGDAAFDPDADFNGDDVIDEHDLQAFREVLASCNGDVVTSVTFAPPPDGLTNAADLAYMLGAWGNQPSCADFVTSVSFSPPPDGIVDAADLAFLLGAWGSCE